MHRRSLFAILAVICALTTGDLMAQRDRISGPVRSDRRVTLAGHRIPLTTADNDLGRVDALLVLPSVTVLLKPSPAQQADLEKFLGEQQDPQSPNYHHWITPEEYADRFGVSQDDVDQVVAWIKGQGLDVTGVARGRNWISLSGTASQVSAAFQTELHSFDVNGEQHFANISDPTVPEALGPVVQGIQGLNDFRMQPRRMNMRDLEPKYNSTNNRHYLAPDDVATIYNLTPLLNSGINGTGQKIAVVGQTQINLSDIQQFRSRFGLPPSDPQIVLVPTSRDPGVVSGDQDEAHLDLEWAGAVARNATLYYVYANSVTTALQYAIDQNIAPVVSMSYGLCEALSSRSELLALQSYARQANAQGQTWVNSSGDSGGSDCSSSSTSGGGLAVDQPGSIPEVTSVGGTTFTEGTGTFWKSSNDDNGASATSYIPESVWNDAGGDPSSGGGGSSVFFVKPTWQTGAGVPSDGARDVPDISLSASPNHDGYLVITGSALRIFGGTSASAPVFGGILALLNQYMVSNGVQSVAGLGNINPRLYALAQTTPGVFNDITVGDNIVTINCSTRARNCSSGSFGYAAGPGYDQATGLGSINANNLINAYRTDGGGVSKGTPNLTLASSARSINSSGLVNITAVVTSTNGSTPQGTVKFLLGDQSLGSATLQGSGGTATATLQVTGAQLPVGSQLISVLYSGDNSFNGATASISVTVTSDATGSPSISGLTNAASFRTAYAPGMLLSVFGTQLAPSVWSASTVPLPLSLAGVSVTINGVAAPLYYVSPSQLNVQIPYETQAGGNATVVVNNNGATASQSFAVSAAAPGIFVNQQFAPVPSTSGARGQIVTLFITGEGAVTPSLPTGAGPASGTTIANLPHPTQKLTVTVGTTDAGVQFAGITVGLVGVTQVNYTIPANASPGVNSVVVTVGGVPSSPASLTVTQ